MIRQVDAQKEFLYWTGLGFVAGFCIGVVVGAVVVVLLANSRWPVADLPYLKNIAKQWAICMDLFFTL